MTNQPNVQTPAGRAELIEAMEIIRGRWAEMVAAPSMCLRMIQAGLDALDAQAAELAKLRARLHDLEAHGGVPEVVQENAALRENNRALEAKVERTTQDWLTGPDGLVELRRQCTNPEISRRPLNYHIILQLLDAIAEIERRPA